MDTLLLLLMIPVMYFIFVRIPMHFIYNWMPPGKLKTFLFKVRWNSLASDLPWMHPIEPPAKQKEESAGG